MAEMDTIVGEYLQARELLRLLDEAHDKKRAPLVEYQDKRAGLIREFMDTNKLENLKTSAGTAYVSTRFTASLADPEAFMQYVIQSGKFELMDRRANSTAVKDFVKETNQLPPGCNLNAIQTVGVRVPTKKKSD